MLRHWFLDPYRSDFMRQAAIMAVIIGILAPSVGVWVVLRRLAYLGDAMSHGSLAGIAGAYLLGFPLVLGALCAGLVMGSLVVVLERRQLGQDTAIGVVEAALFAIGVIVISSTDRIGVDLLHYLFGQLVTVTRTDLMVNALLATVVVVALVVFVDDLRAVTFDPLHAVQVGVSSGRTRFLLTAAISVTVVISLDTIGTLMSIAMLVVPAATARLVTNRIETMTAVAIAIGVVSALGGLTLSYHLASPPGPTIALTAAAAFALVATGTSLGRRPSGSHLARSSGGQVAAVAVDQIGSGEIPHRLGGGSVD